MMGSAYQSFIGRRTTFGLGIIDPRDIAGKSFGIHLWFVSGSTLRGSIYI